MSLVILRFFQSMSQESLNVVLHTKIYNGKVNSGLFSHFNILQRSSQWDVGLCTGIMLSHVTKIKQRIPLLWPYNKSSDPLISWIIRFIDQAKSVKITFSKTVQPLEEMYNLIRFLLRLYTNSKHRKMHLSK